MVVQLSLTCAATECGGAIQLALTITPGSRTMSVVYCKTLHFREQVRKSQRTGPRFRVAQTITQGCLGHPAIMQSATQTPVLLISLADTT